MQYYGGILRISEWAHIVNVSILGGEGIVDTLTQTINALDFQHRDNRAFLMLAEMTSKGSFASGAYTEKYIELARANPKAIV